MLRPTAAAASLANILQPNSISNPRANSLARLGLGTSNPSISSNNTSDPFATQLTQAIESYLSSNGQSGNLNSPLQIQITPQTPSGSALGVQGTRQFIVTVSQPGATTTSPAAAAASVPVSAAQAAPAATSADANTTTASTATPVPAAVVAPPAPTNEVDAYWATQPPAVQVLRTLPTEAERGAKATELAAQGYSIDVPIMVWGYDPIATMITRKSEGYTWTPSLGQGDPPTPPGINMPEMQSYNPSQPPAGSIKVSTDFGIGLEKTSPWAGAFGDLVLS